MALKLGMVKWGGCILQKGLLHGRGDSWMGEVPQPPPSPALLRAWLRTHFPQVLPVLAILGPSQRAHFICEMTKASGG